MRSPLNGVGVEHSAAATDKSSQGIQEDTEADSRFYSSDLDYYGMGAHPVRHHGVSHLKNF